MIKVPGKNDNIIPYSNHATDASKVLAHTDASYPTIPYVENFKPTTTLTLVNENDETQGYRAPMITNNQLESDTVITFVEKENTTSKVETPEKPEIEAPQQPQVATPKSPNQEENVTTHDTSSYWVVTLVIAMLGLFIGYRKK